MITVKLYGLLRIEYGIKMRQIEARCIQDVLDDLEAQGISRKDLTGCVILINEKPANNRSLLNDGDVVQLLSPVAGG